MGITYLGEDEKLCVLHKWRVASLISMRNKRYGKTQKKKLQLLKTLLMDPSSYKNIHVKMLQFFNSHWCLCYGNVWFMYNCMLLVSVSKSIVKNCFFFFSFSTRRFCVFLLGRPYSRVPRKISTSRQIACRVHIVYIRPCDDGCQ